jgi:uncharacterized membrane protein YeiH
MESLSFWIGFAGTVAFAVTAVLAVAPKSIDLFGATVMGIITAIGGPEGAALIRRPLSPKPCTNSVEMTPSAEIS